MFAVIEMPSCVGMRTVEVHAFTPTRPLFNLFARVMKMAAGQPLVHRRLKSEGMYFVVHKENYTWPVSDAHASQIRRYVL